jgi:AcrR family transcriptional regulator
VSVVKPVRKRDREATRARIVDAARDLFLEQGYARTTIADVARAAEVAPQTVYWAFGSKAGLVREIRDTWFASAGTGERMALVLAIDDPDARLDAFAGFMRHQWETGAAALSIQRDALRSDPDAAADVAAILETRARALFEVVRPLGPHLADGLTAERAHDILLALTLLEVYLELQARSWSGDEYEAWLAAALRSELLGSKRLRHLTARPGTGREGG